MDNAVRAGLVGGILAGLLFAIKHAFQLVVSWNNTKGKSAERLKNAVHSESANGGPASSLNQTRRSQPEPIITPKAPHELHPENSSPFALVQSAGPRRAPKPPTLIMNQGPSRSPHNLASYERLATEKQAGTRLESLWLKCFTEAAGDTHQADINYNAARVAMFEEEDEENRHVALIERANALHEWRCIIMDHLSNIQPWFHPMIRCLAGRQKMIELRNGLENGFSQFQQALPVLRTAIIQEDWQGDLLNAEMKAIVDRITQEKAFTMESNRPIPPWSDCFRLITGGQKWQDLEAKVANSLSDIADMQEARERHRLLLRDASVALAHEKLPLAKDILDQTARGRFADLDYASVETAYQGKLAESNSRASFIAIGIIIVAIVIAIYLFA